MDSDEKLNIFDVLNQINHKNYHFYDELPEHLQKQFNPYLVFQWLTGTDNPDQLMLLAHYVNDKVLNISSPRLLYKLFCTTSCGTNTRYNWLYSKKDSKLIIDIVSEYYECSRRIAKMQLNTLSMSDIKEMAFELGYQDSEIKKLSV